MTVFNPPKSNLLHIEVINAIINAIVSGSLKPGDRIIEQHIAEQMQISRAPVREAIRELVAQDIIKFLPRKGAYIAPLNPKNVQEVYLLRSCLEGLAARLATEWLTEADLNQLYLLNFKMGEATLKNDALAFIESDLAFHDLICHRCDHAQLIKMLEGVRVQTRLYMIMSKWNLVAHSQLNREMNAHQPILDAFRERNPEAAEQTIRAHIITSGNLLLEYLAGDEEKENPEKEPDESRL
ncbi:DNA-binding GntR family transcriptional regulator [Hydrogenispora ethanolica]|jgi:DNA-binding GntR family transcriptional regulator|uniref:DNA-binding GntR family transcriptional regulator n=1 Tax=Hydrogenispora ethanolica TaxID=1082276 RepID=A0A4R1RVR6_HYDET|nr:GntR family transcriptional regulator [Hydrogenispora ethanolica]TCL70042.1 DNA-binding GntR family transcriptional regulator [Hydrogenispora ethanolica]